ncbi:BTAD domain-containing putative transcriptional regulator [Catenulispora yoronensis]
MPKTVTAVLDEVIDRVPVVATESIEGAKEFLEIRLIGGVYAVFNGRQLDFGGVPSRTLLAALVLSADQAVSKIFLIDAIWGLNAPSTASQLLADYVSRLRSILAPASSLISLRATRDGFLAKFTNAATVVDVHRFQSLILQADIVAEAGDTEEEQFLVQQALDWWPEGAVPLAGLESSWARNQARMLSRLRLGAVERLALGATGARPGERMDVSVPISPHESDASSRLGHLDNSTPWVTLKSTRYQFQSIFQMHTMPAVFRRQLRNGSQERGSLFPNAMSRCPARGGFGCVPEFGQLSKQRALANWVSLPLLHLRRAL